MITNKKYTHLKERWFIILLLLYKEKKMSKGATVQIHSLLFFLTVKHRYVLYELSGYNNAL